MENIWDIRYGKEEYFYGKEPNNYFKQEIGKLPPGKILLPGEGEGRNAVYAATLGWDVYAIDMSEAGRQKAFKLASEKGLNIRYEICNLQTYQYPVNEFDAVAIIFAHFPSKSKPGIYARLLASLKSKGIIIIESFSKKQLGRSSGGSQNIDLLDDMEELKSYLADFDIIESSDIQLELCEGEYHRGLADVIRIIAKKN